LDSLSDNALDQSVDLPMGGSLKFTVQGNIDPSVTDTLSDTATITAPAGVIDPDANDLNTNNSSTDTTALIPDADVQFSSITAASLITGATSEVYANGDDTQNTAVFTVVIKNSGPSTGHHVTLTLNPGPVAHLSDRPSWCLPATTDCTDANNYTLYTSAGIDAGELLRTTLTPPAAPTLTVMVREHAISIDRGGPFPNTVQGFHVSVPSPSTDTHPGNNDGDSSSTPLTVYTVPSTPTPVASTDGDGTLGVSWTGSASNGGKDITAYRLYSDPCGTGGSPCRMAPDVSSGTFTGGGGSFTNLFSGFQRSPTPYSLTLRAVNVVGESSDSDPALKARSVAAAQTKKITSTTSATSLDTGVTNGALTCDPSLATCKVIVSKFAFTETKPGNVGALVNTDVEKLPLNSSGNPDLCQKIELNPADTLNFGKQVQGDCTGNLGVRSTYPNVPGSPLHLESDLVDRSITVDAEGYPCRAVKVNSDGTIAYSTPPTGVEKMPICTDPSYPINTTATSSSTNPAVPGTNLCDSEGEFGPSPQHWTLQRPCAYIYYETIQIPKWNITGTRPAQCTPGDAFCGTPTVIGSSVDNGLLVRKSGVVVQIVKPWCNGKFPNFKNTPCISSYVAQTGKGVSAALLYDILDSIYIPEIDLIKGTNNG
jgi:hypothetical protein